MKTSLLKYFITVTLLPLCAGCGDDNQHASSNPLSSQPNHQDVVESVTNYRLNYNVTYTGKLINGLPNGDGVFKYRNNDTLKTTLLNNQVDQSKVSEFVSYTTRDKFTGKLTLDEEYNYHFIEGTYDYGTNAKTYQGKFKNNLFHDDNGKLNFSEKSYYIGQFKNGSNIGLIGTIYFDSYANKTEGVWNFEGVMKTESSFVINQMGKGKILFGDKSYYTGELFFDGNGYFRKGYGEMDFTACRFLAGTWGASDKEYIAYYHGEFDYEISQWIYGNGIMYYTDFNMKPTGWAKGKFSACHLIDEYSGDDFELKEGYTMDMEKKYLRFREDYDRYLVESSWEKKHHKYLFVGDSYMEFMNSQPNTPFSKYFGEYDALDVGCGGSTAADWLNYYDDLVKPYSPEIVILHIGENDINQFATYDMIEGNVITFINMCKNDFPDIKFYIVGKMMNYSNRNTYHKSHQLNFIFDKITKQMDKVDLIPVEDLVLKDVNTLEPVDDLKSYFTGDGIHLNDKGYILWSSRIKEYI